MNERARTLENKHWLMTGPAETFVAQNLQQDCKCMQGLSNYYTLWTSQGWSYCRVQEFYCNSDEKLLKVKSYQKCKILILLL